ncbi:hypothetical protein [Desulfovibrio sp. JC022]|uniref:hypothetical protein n=1 Tax=Desulfovibrio sp. JC022 TaxID=2593642 RepID=UPI0010AA5600|nr:hypothetical protein [Desulfovibrio sp. JC022]NDV24433.1 hypothetical protein [Desulfovibrio sp. JC022]TIH12071.1 hypothetical protein D0S45_19220 [Marinifilum sp. JC120]
MSNSNKNLKTVKRYLTGFLLLFIGFALCLLIYPPSYLSASAYRFTFFMMATAFFSMMLLYMYGRIKVSDILNQGIASVKEKDKVINELITENSQLKEEADGLVRDYDQLSEEVAALASEKDRLKEEASILINEKDQLRNEVSELKSKPETDVQHSDDSQGYKAKIESLETQLAEKEEIINKSGWKKWYLAACSVMGEIIRENTVNLSNPVTIKRDAFFERIKSNYPDQNEKEFGSANRVAWKCVPDTVKHTDGSS